MSANVKFSQLPNLTTITANTIIPVVSGNVNYTVTSANLQTYVNGGAGNITTGNLSATGNITGAYISGNGSLLTNLNGANVTGTVANATYASSSGTAVTVTGNAQPNITSVGILSSLSVTGNISTSSYFIGNGSQLTGLPASYTNSNVVSLLSSFGSNTISTTGNVSAGYFIGNGSQLTGLPASYGNANVAAYLPTYSGNIANLTVTGTTVLNPYVETLYAAGSVSSSYTPTISNGPVQTFTPSGNFTLAAPSGMTTGQSITLIITQPSGGNAVMTANTAYKFAYGVNTLSTAGNAIDMMSIFYSGSNYLCNLVKGYQ